MPTRRQCAVTMIVLLALALTGCGGAGGEPAAEPSDAVTADVEAVESPTPTPTEPEPTITQPPTSQRGNVIKQIGETAYLTMSPTDMTPWLEFQVTDIAVAPECSGEFAEPPENGNFLIVSLNISTATTWPTDVEGIPLDFNPNDWSVVGEDGVTESALGTAATYSCLDESELLPVSGIGPGENVVGKLVLDSKNATGVLVYKPWYAPGGGWEWTF